MTEVKMGQDCAKWSPLEMAFASTRLYANPFQDVQFTVTLTSPTGKTRTVDGFWNGGLDWRFRVMPDEVGTWHYETHCSDSANFGLEAQGGAFTCSEPQGATRFERHGRLRLSADGTHLEHADGTAFFWMGDTAWNGPMLATPDEWNLYLKHRKEQQFTAVQWVATQWISAPDGDWTGEFPYSGRDKIIVHPAFFQRLDQKIVAMNRAGLLSVPVMLWAAIWTKEEIKQRNPGVTLSEEQAVKLARYMLARWGAYHTTWMLPGDGDYRAEKAERWQNIGRETFKDAPQELVTVHPGGLWWVRDEFVNEPWYNYVGYQSGHGNNDNSFNWIVNGPPAVDWNKQPIRPFINLEAPYENHISHTNNRVHDDHSVRRATYWSLLVAPTAGVTYGGHGIWGWDDGSVPPVGHDKSGIPFHWQKALTMPAAEQMRHVVAAFASVDWWALHPANDVLAQQPGNQHLRQWISVGRSKKALVLYLPENEGVFLKASALPASPMARWIDPRNGNNHAATFETQGDTLHAATPTQGDWLLIIEL
jgi:hypothetical protein